MCRQVIDVYAWDFRHGSYLASGSHVTYRLQEDITFHPNAHSDFQPTDQGTVYDPLAVQLGFTAAIVITGRNIEWDFNGHLLEYSAEFALQQRFGSLLQLGATPFVQNKGAPVGFVKDNVFQGKVVGLTIHGGTLGRSPHHSIQGNDATNVRIVDMVIRDFEVAAISYNDWRQISLHRCHIQRNRQDIPVLSAYSQARFLLPFARRILQHANITEGAAQEGRDKIAALDKRLRKVQREVVQQGYTHDRLFGNPSGLLDGASYGLLGHGAGPAVHGMGIPTAPSRGLVLENVLIENIVAAPRQFLGLSVAPTLTVAKREVSSYGAGVQHDCVGAVLDIALVWDPLTDEYVPNELADLQGYVGFYQDLLDEDARNRITLSTGVLEWLRVPGTKLNTILEREALYCIDNGDSMFHVHKGVFGMRLDCVEDIWLRNVKIRNIRNLGLPSRTLVRAHTLEPLPRQDHPTQLTVVDGAYEGCTARGLMLAACARVSWDDLHIHNVLSECGDAIGLEAANSDLSTFDAIEQVQIDCIVTESEEGHVALSTRGFEAYLAAAAAASSSPPTTDDEHHHHHHHHSNSLVRYSSSFSSSAAVVGCPFLH